MTDTAWPAKPTLFILQPLTGKSADPNLHGRIVFTLQTTGFMNINKCDKLKKKKFGKVHTKLNRLLSRAFNVCVCVTFHRTH